MVSKENLLTEIKDLIIDSLNLHFVDREQLGRETTLMGDGGLGLDSVDILEVVVGVEQKYGVKIENAEQGREVFRSLGSIVDFIDQSKTTSKTSRDREVEA